MTDLFDVIGMPGPDLLLRPNGELAFPVLKERLLAVPEGRSLTLELKGVRVVDTSFADETFIALSLGLIGKEYGDRFLLLNEPTEATVINLEGTIARRTERLAVLVRIDGRVRPVGDLERNLAETWELTLSLGTLTARRLADQLGIEIQAASTRLLKLYQGRLLTRIEEVGSTGRQHIYRVPE